MNHPDAVRAACLTVSSMGHRAWPRNVGVFQDQRGNFRRIGTKGEADIQGILRGGWALALEIKTGRATREADQVTWGRMWASLGGCYVLARYSASDDGDAMIRATIEEFLASRAAERRYAA